MFRVTSNMTIVTLQLPASHSVSGARSGDADQGLVVVAAVH